MSGPVRVMVVDDQPLVRRLIRYACDDRGMELVGEVRDGERALAECRRLAPDVVVLDPRLAGADGLDLARRLRAEPSGPRVLILTHEDEGSLVLAAMRAGADGYVAKSASIDEVADALEAVASGGRAFTREQEQAALGELGGRVRQAREVARVEASLTPRQREVLRLVARSLSTADIARRLGISERGVRSHLTALYRHLGVRGRVEAMRRAVELGFVEERED